MAARFRMALSARLALAAALLVCAGGCWIEVEEDEADLQSSITAMLETSAAEWNEGDLDGFMDDYVEADATTYIGGQGMLIGYAAIFERYAPLFADGAARDSLRFEEIRTRRLGAVDGVVTARWVLHTDGTVTASGPLTLVVRRTSAGWRIIHDHSSSDPQPVAE